MDYADHRFYNSGHGFSRFMTADPFKRSAKVNDSGSWNRYSYSSGDPINRTDSSGLFDCFAGYDGAGCGTCGEDEECDKPIQGGGAPEPTKPNPPPTCLTAVDERLLNDPNVSSAAKVLLGEDSWGFIGKRSYNDGEAYGKETGAIITSGDVAKEDALMVDVLINRSLAGGFGGNTVAAVASAPGQFAYQRGQVLFDQTLSATLDSSDCTHLLTALEISAVEISGTSRAAGLFYWTATVQPSTNTARTRGQYDVRVADTDFAASEFGKLHIY